MKRLQLGRSGPGGKGGLPRMGHGHKTRAPDIPHGAVGLASLATHLFFQQAVPLSHPALCPHSWRDLWDTAALLQTLCQLRPDLEASGDAQ